MPRVTTFIPVVIVIFLLSFGQNSYGQRLKIDSLLTVLKGDIPDSVRLRAYADIAFDFTYINLDSASFYADKALEVALIGDDIEGEMKALYTNGVVEYSLGNYDDSFNYLERSLAIANSVNSKQSGFVYNMMGRIYQDKSQFDKAIEHYYKSAELAEEKEDFVNWVVAMVNIANVHYDLKDMENCIRIYQDIISKEDQLIPQHSSMILANYTYLIEDPDEKSKYLNRSIAIAKEHGIVDTEANGYKLLGDLYMQNPESADKALAIYQDAIALYERIGLKTEISKSLTNYGSALLELDHNDEALIVLKRADEIAQSIGFSTQVVTVNEILAILYEKENKFKKALESIKIYNSIRDSVYESSVSESVLEANAKYESEKKEAEIARQQLEITKQESDRQLLTLGAVGGFSILSLLFFGFYQRYKRKNNESELALKNEKKRATDLQKLEKLKTDFFNNVSHELRTPLTMIIAPLEDLSKKIKNVHDKKDVDLALSNSRRLLNLTNEIMDISKIEVKKLDVVLTEIELEPFLKRVFFSFDSLARTRDITLLSFNLEQATLVKVDQLKLEKVIINLVSNAIKYSPDNSTISIDLNLEKLKSGALNFTIIDNGHGINYEDQSYIFDRFYQSKNTSHSSGTGIGLSLVKDLVTLMGGWINLESEPGNGSTFRVQIPIDVLRKADNHDGLKNEKVITMVVEERAFHPIMINGQKPKILIVEDDVEMSEYLTSLLSNYYICDSAYNGKQALEQLRKSKYDLITSDVMMPEMGGFELREQINNNSVWRQIPFIMLTARSLEDDILKGFRLGVDDYITKPFSTAEYRARINNLLRNKNERDTFKSNEIENLSEEQDFVKKAESIVVGHIDDSSFTVTNFAAEMNYSGKQLGRKLQGLTGLTPVAFILEVRLQRAYNLIRSKKHPTVNQVMYEVGIESASYFNTKFSERFGISPGKVV